MTEPLRILFVEDLPTDQELAAWQLRSGGLDFTGLRVETQEAFLQALEDFRPDLIISDYSMPEFDGLRALKLVLELKRDIPFIVLTGSINEETAALCIKAGASDYVIKEHIHRLPFAVQEAMNQKRARIEKALAEASLRASETRYRGLFEDSPISLWEEDFSAVKGRLDELRAGGVTDFKAYFIEHPQEVVACAGLVKVVDVNKASLELFGAASKAEMYINLAIMVPADNFEHIRDEFVLIANGEKQFHMEAVNRTLDGRIIELNINWAAMPGHDDDLSKVIVSMVDITERKQAEKLQNAIYWIAQAADQAESPEALYPAIHAIIQEVMPADNFYIALYDEKNDLLSFPYSVDEMDPFPVPKKPGKGLTEYVLRTGKPLLCDEALNEELKQGGEIEPIGEPSAIWLGVPLTMAGKVIGAMAVQDYRNPGAYTERELRILEFVSSQVAMAISRKQTEEALKLEQYLTRTLMDTIPDTIYFKDSQSRFIRINQAQAKKLGVNDPEQARGKTDFDFFVPEHARIAFKDEEEIMRTGLPLINAEELLGYPGRPSEWVSATKFPLRDLNGQIVGTFGISRDISALKQAEERLLIQSEELQKSNIELARLYRISESLISSKPFDLQGLAQAIVDTVVREFDITNCGLYIIKKSSNDLDRLAYAGEIDEKYRTIKLKVDGPGLIAMAIRTRQVVNVADVLSHPDYLPGWEEARSELVIPLYLKDAVFGVLDLESDRVANFTVDDEKLLQTFANQAAVVLENTNLIAETGRQVQRLNSLRIIDGAINASLDITLTTSILLEQITDQLKVDAADILIFNPFTKSLKYANGRGFTTSALQQTDLRLGQGLAGRAASERQVVHVSDLGSEGEFFKASPHMREEHFVEYYGVPLISKGSIKGLLEIFHRSPLKEEPAWLGFLGTLAGEAAIAIDNIRMFEDLQNSNNELMMAYDATIEGWSRALEVRDQETEGHTQRVTTITMRLAKAVGMKGEELVHMRRGALLHDIGKMGIADSILLKPGPLTDEEWVVMRRHPDYAFELLSPIAFLKPALDIPYCHHEKWDGSGYPRGLKGEQIPLSARLFAIADVWDALTSDRPYRKAWPDSKAIEYIREQAGKHFDPQAFEVFERSYLSMQTPFIKPTLLIVDDEESITRSLARSLKDQFTVLTANSGEDALRIVERTEPSVILADQRMPGMSGVELLERVREIRPNSVAILISGYSDVLAFTAAINLSNVRGFIPKPWDLEALRTKLEEAVFQYREMARGFNE